MEYRYLGNTGLRVSALSLGSYLTFGHTVDLDMAKKLMQTAYDAEVNLFDNAEAYALGQSEILMGKAFQELQWARDTYLIMTKVFWGGPKPTQLGLHRKHIFEACHASLKRLRTDYIDLFVCHRPDEKTPLPETVWAMNQLIQQGKILYWGTSEWSALEIAEAISFAEKHHLIPPSLEQFQYNMLERAKGEKEYVPLFSQKKLGAITTMPLAGGLLTGKYLQKIPVNSRFFRHPDISPPYSMPVEEWQALLQKIQSLTETATDLGVTLSQLAIAWCLTNSHISSVIIGASNEEQLRENLQTLDKISSLTPAALQLIEGSLNNKPSIFVDYLYDYTRISLEV